MSKGAETQPELPLPSQEAQEAATGAEMAELLQAVISAVTALGARVDALSGKQDASLEAITDQQSATTEDLARQIGTYSADMRKVRADLQKLQSHIDGGDYRQTMQDDIRNHVGHLKEEVGFLSSALDSHIEKFGAINHEAGKIIERAINSQDSANQSLETARDFMRLHVRLVIFIAFVLAAASVTIGYQAALKYETDTGTWAHQLKKAWSPIGLCNEMEFDVQRGADGTHFCISRLKSIP